MTTSQSAEPAPRKPLRLWPGVTVALLVLLVRFALPIVIPDAATLAIIGGVVGALLIAVWWLFFSRAPWAERLGAVVLMIAAMLATSRLVHISVSNGMMGMMLPMFGIQVLSLALVAWAVGSRHLASGPRRVWLIATILLACGALTLVRTGGITGGGDSDLHWRWTQTPEERLLAGVRDEPAAQPSRPTAAAPEKGPASQSRAEPTAPGPASAPAAAPEKQGPAPSSDKASTRVSTAVAAEEDGGDWPGFRGLHRDSVVRGVRIATDWSASPPVQVWRRPIGPGWSSFAVRGDLLYTQEQRGDDEIVASYRVSTGEPVWRHRDGVRFWESNGGAGPRATPTLSNGRIYTFGATGILNALDAASGAVVWSRNVASDSHTQVPEWGFASSPLVVDDVVIVAADATLVGYDLATGHQRWVGPVHRGSYSSPHRTTIDGVLQVLMLGGAGAISVAPATGQVLWEHAWRGVAIVQPALTADGDVLINTLAAMGGNGVRRVSVAHGPDGWRTEERWTSSGLKPYFNDFVIHKGHAFGFDGSMLASIDLADGKRTWKGGRYGNGQIVLLADQDLLLVLSEEGGLALVAATPDQFKEVTRFPAIEGKTWNHPALAGDVLLVRNGEEMAAFRLPLAGR